MKALAQLILVGAGALGGLAGGYIAFKPNERSCQSVYSERIAELEEQNKDITTPGVATPRDISLSYVVSREHNFRGLVYTDAATGKKGVVTRQQILGEASYGLPYANLDQLLQGAPQIPVQPGIDYNTKRQ